MLYQKMMKKRADGAAIAVTDDTMVVEEYGKIQVKVIEGSYTNIKITTPADFYIFRAIIDARENMQILGL